ncbi:MAG: DUF3822 family protein [Paludibacteraceae bacterium]|nr:DUF3822 family protein [Paludibacteraceae bacterium]
MGYGDFAVVPSFLVDDGNALSFLTSCSVTSSNPRLSVHKISDDMTIVADATNWEDSCSCHEVEPLIVDCLHSGVDSVHALLSANRLYVAVLKNNALAYINKFTVNCNEDSLYHILAAYQATALDRMRNTLFAHGGLDKLFLNKYIDKCV